MPKYNLLAFLFLYTILFYRLILFGAIQGKDLKI